MAGFGLVAGAGTGSGYSWTHPKPVTDEVLEAVDAVIVLGTEANLEPRRNPPRSLVRSVRRPGLRYDSRHRDGTSHCHLNPPGVWPAPRLRSDRVPDGHLAVSVIPNRRYSGCPPRGLLVGRFLEQWLSQGRKLSWRAWKSKCFVGYL